MHMIKNQNVDYIIIPIMNFSIFPTIRKKWKFVASFNIWIAEFIIIIQCTASTTYALASIIQFFLVRLLINYEYSWQVVIR